MTSIDEQLIKIRELRDLALKGESDENISRETGFNVWQTTELRKALGIYRSVRKSVVDGFRTATLSKGYFKMAFSISPIMAEDLGLKVKPNQKLKYTGKIKGDTLVLSFKTETI